MKKDSGHQNTLAVILFPEIFDDVVEILCKRMPILKISCMRGFLIHKASFFTMFAVSATDEPNYDINEEYGEDVDMCVSFNCEDTPIPSKEFENEIRRYSNYNYLDKMITNHVCGLASSRKILKFRK